MKVIFIDRDGVLNKDPGGWTEHNYVTRWEDFIFMPVAKEALKKLTDEGYKIIIISNQGGINKGIFTMNDLTRINENMLKEITSYGAKIHAVYYCPHTKDEGCDCRKPNTGLLKKATRNMNIDFSKTFFIGDGPMDIEAGKRAGCRTILLLCGKSELADVKNWIYKPDYIKRDLLEAVDWILKGQDGDR